MEPVPRAEPASRFGNPASYEVLGRRYQVSSSSAGYLELGDASWYGTKFHGRRTSSGEPYDMYALTAAHKSLPIPTFARVTNLGNGRSVVVRVNDRGPFHAGRIIDLSYAAAHLLEMLGDGTARVQVEALPPYQSLDGRTPAKPTTRAAKVAAPASESTGDAAFAGAQGSIFLQVGAFSERDNAQRMLMSLEREMPGLVEIYIASGAPPTYRVRVGPLGSAAGARSAAEQLASLGHTDTHVVAP
jgi:rare lipoprotein A